MSTSASAHAVRAALLNHDFTADGVLNEIGAEAFAALGRGERVPALHVLAERDDTALIALIRLFLLGEPLPPEAVRRCLPWSHAHGLGLVEEVEQSSGGVLVRPVIQVHPYPCDGRDCFVVSDFPLASAAGRGRRAGGDHVVGVGGASVTLATLTPRVVAARALDLGTGCGVQALNLAGHCRSVVATDRNLRALEMASISAALSGIELDLRHGSLYEPVADDDFDLIVANPPFVISPHARFTYRETTLAADDLTRDVIVGAAQRLAPGGTAVILGNWLHTEQEEWTARLRRWTADVECSVWGVQRESQTLAEYVELWLRDSDDHNDPGYERLYSEWLTALLGWGARRVGFGWVVLAKPAMPGESAAPAGSLAGEAPPSRWFLAEDLSEAERLPTGAEVVEQLAALQRWHDGDASSLLAGRAHWTGRAILHTAASASTGQPIAGAVVEAVDGWRPPVEVDQRVAAVLNDSGTLLDRIQRLQGADGEGEEEGRLDVVATVLIGVRDLIAAGLVDWQPSL